jgi:Sap-like sulfolipid-1-addressing protein
VLAQAAGLALLAALSPTALLIVAVYLGSARPRATVACYLAGAIVMTAVTAIVVVVAVRDGGLYLPSNRAPRYGLRLGLGVLAIGAAVLAARRKPRPPDPAKPSKGLMSRLVARPRPVAAVLAGVVVFAPSPTFLAAVQVVATSPSDLAVSSLGLVMIVAVTVTFVWLPLFAHLAWPEQTARGLAVVNGWLRAHGRQVVVAALAVAGAYLIVNGLSGLL